uniref:Uncharacterized protein n=1 Tax=Meloidogyne enterolobii TaxID=390850 RepID=A0A6V7W5I4_MELEN|nr:unnamed protein product [Meloidogyne enterolobii]
MKLFLLINYLKIIIFNKFILQLKSATSSETNNCLLGDIPSIVKIDEYGHPELYCQPPVCNLFLNFERNNENNNKIKCNNDNNNNKLIINNYFCNKSNEWIGEIKEEENNLKQKCCLIPNLSQWAAPLKKVVIKKGEKFEGGPVLNKGGEIIAFDLVKEIYKNVTKENSLIYILTIYRALCPSSSSSTTTTKIPIQNSFSKHFYKFRGGNGIFNNKKYLKPQKRFFI